MSLIDQPLSRRGLLGAAGLAAAALAVPARSAVHSGINPELQRRALAAMSRHRGQIAHTDRMAIVDFARASREPRFHILDLVSGTSTTLLVAHGRGSDPRHTGWLQSFSNTEGSNASSPGAYATGNIYVGKHGRSLRLQGLDPSNSAAEPRAIVVHAAWYVSPVMAATTGIIGRSQGCFALTQDNLEPVLATLGAGRMIYADKV